MIKNYSIDELKDFLVLKGVKPSIQRLKILGVLLKEGHPSVDDIYKALIDEIPTLSKTTVYNTLNLFIEKGIARSLFIGGENEYRYEFISKPHAHFKCIECGKIYDLKLNCDIFEKRNLNGFKINEALVFLKGICKECQNLKNP